MLGVMCCVVVLQGCCVGMMLVSDVLLMMLEGSWSGIVDG